MSQKESLQGLSCPNCGGVVPIPEGQVVVCCPYCNLRSLVKGERGLLRYQVPLNVQRQGALQALRDFLSRNLAIARDAKNKAQVTEVFVAYLPFWIIWARVLGWAFGQKKVGSGDRSHYEAREVEIVEEMSWNGVACDVGEFGVTHVPLTSQPLVAFKPDDLHAQGMVFEPVGSFSEARSSAAAYVESQVRRRANLDRISQLFVRYFKQRFGLVYYPLWVLRYLYRGRAFQVVVDGFSGKVLYGKGPGNTLYRAAVLVGGMALGAFLAVDVSAAILSNTHGDNSAAFGLVVGLVGLGIMFFAYRAFRYGEQFEYRSGGSSLPAGLPSPSEFMPQFKDLEQWIDRLS